jgi:2-aminoadipate transaminase
LAVDDPTYAGALDLFRGRRTELVPVDDVSADARYAMPALMNPWGRAMTVAERAQALALPFVLEDDAYADLRFDGPPPPPLLVEARERVFFIGSFSKVLAPGLRVGWLVAPRAFTSRVQELKAQNDVHTGALAQAIVERVLDELDFEAHVASLRSLYAARCGRLVEALREAPHLSFTPPEGGFGVWIRCDVPADDAHWLARAIAAGVAFDPGSLFRVHAGAQLELRACFSFVDPARMRCGVERLARLLEPRHSVAA